MSVKQGPQQGTDIAPRIGQILQQMDVPAIPRNYELIYEAYTGTNPDLTSAVKDLRKGVTQDELDELAERFLGHQGGFLVRRAHQEISRELEVLLGLLALEQSSLESYRRVLGETSERIAAKQSSSADILRNAVSILSEATGKTMAQGQEIADSVGERSSEMERVKLELDEYKRIANTDPLTRLANRRAFDEAMAKLYENAASANHSTLLLIDIDHFKRVNDTHGHPVGDRVLSILGNVMRANLRNDVFVARTGGEEFAVILHDVDEDVALRIAERLRTAIETTPLQNLKKGTNYGPVTISIGVCADSAASNGEELYRKCDMALYTAKAGGRNRVLFYHEGMNGASLGNRLLYRRGVA